MSSLPKVLQVMRAGARAQVRATALVVGLVAAGACSSNSTDGGAGGGSNASGDCKTGTNAPFANPSGTPFLLPAGIVLDGEISGDIDTACASRPIVEYGGDLLPACVPLRNTTGADITVRIPAGLTFIAKNPQTQNGIVLQDHELVVPAQSSVAFHFRLFCLNEHCAYGTKEDRFTFGNVTDDARLREIIDLARTKELELGGVGASVFGALVWDVTDGAGITDAHRALLADVPDA